MKRSTICVAVLSLMLVACTGGGTLTVTVQATPTPTAIPTPSTTPTPSASAPAPLTKTQAAAEYAKIVKPSNATITALNKLRTSTSFKKQRTLAGQMVAQDRTLAEQLIAIAWPTSVEALTQQLSVQVAGEIRCYSDLSHAKTWRSFVSVNNSSECTFDPSSKVAESIRIRLGLPNVPV